MPAVTATAPGKVILFGEHAVVYGRPALAAPVHEVQARAIVRADPRGRPGRVRVEAPEVGLEAELDALPADHPLARALSLVLAELGIDRPPACRVRIVSTIPVAAGLGSGAAVSVAVIRAFARFLGRPLDPEDVSALAYEVEKLHHGTPSGIDNTVVTWGRPVCYVRGEPLQPLAVPSPFTLVIADTGVPSPTAKTVGDVRRGWERDPAIFERRFDRIGALAEAAREAIESGDVEALGPLMDENQGLLGELGVSSPELERLIEVAREAGASGAKLSGGGRGGNLIALVDPDTGPAVQAALRAAGAPWQTLTRIGARSKASP